MNDADIDYTLRLQRLQNAWWKRAVSVQAPYRWNLRRLQPGFLLDVGCGIGRNLVHLDGHGVGVDHNPHSIAVCREKGLRAFGTDEFPASEYAKPNQFDSLLFAHIAEHMTLPEFGCLFRTYTPYLKTNGKIILITPQEAGFRSDPTHVEFIDFEKHRACLTEAGISIDRAYSFPFPRWVGRFFAHNEFVTIGKKCEPA